jgi:hypothetical protein
VVALLLACRGVGADYSCRLLLRMPPIRAGKVGRRGPLLHVVWLCGWLCRLQTGSQLVKCPLMRQPCRLDLRVFSPSNCTHADPARTQQCRGCTKQQLSDGSQVPARRCSYRDPTHGHNAAALGGVAVTPAPGGLSLCSSMFYGVGSCNAQRNGRPAAISCAKVVGDAPDHGSLSGGQGVLCCNDTKEAGWIGGCKGTAVQQLNLGVGTVQAGASCMPGCKAGYSLMPGRKVTTCNNGELRSAVCLPNPCPTDVVATQPRCPVSQPTCSWSTWKPGSCSTAGQLQHGETCQPTCDPPWQVVGSSRCAAGQMIRAVCQLKCRLPTVPTNGGRGSCIAPLDPGQTCKPLCNDGFKLVPAFGTTCTDASDTVHGPAHLREARCARLA